MRTEIYVQARMGSTRLPGKILKPIMDKPMLHYLVERLKRVTKANASVILTSTNVSDDVVVEFCEQENIPFFRGSENDVLARYYAAAFERKPDIIVRLTADCPLLEPEIIDSAIKTFKKESKCDYVSTLLDKRTLPRGLDVEVFSYKALEKTFQEAIKPEEREHVTPYIYWHPELFKLKSIKYPKDYSQYRLTVDTKEDFLLIEKIYEILYPVKPNFNFQDVIDLLEHQPALVLINAHIQQKAL
jgi:spore coat polysaccharide biosynthesis protein SpsF